MSKDKQLTPVMQAIEKTRENMKQIQVFMSCKITKAERDFFKGSAIALESQINILTSLLPEEEKAMIEFASLTCDKDEAEAHFNETFNTEEV